MWRNSLIITAILSSVAGPALAAGYAVREHSSDAMATAYAGTSANGTDASYMAYNIASLGSVEDADYSANLIAILPTSSANFSTATNALGFPTGGSTTPSSFIDNALIPNFGFRWRVSPQWVVGLSASVPWGLSTNYDAGWAGRYYALKTSLLTANIVPAVAFNPTPHVSVAAGLQIQYAKGILSNAVDIGTLGAGFLIPGALPGSQDGLARLEADDWGYGVMVGLMAEVSDTTIIGLSYRSAVSHTLKGPLEFTLDSAGIGATIRGASTLLSNTDAKADLTTPDIVSFGLRSKISDKMTGLFELGWTNWNVFDELRVDSSNPVQPDDVTFANWESSWFAALGVTYEADKNWLLQAGVAYDQTPIPNETLGPRIPDNDRFWISLGTTFHASETTEIRFTGSHLFIGDAEIRQLVTGTGNALRGNLIGTTDSEVNVVGIQFVYHPR